MTSEPTTPAPTTADPATPAPTAAPTTAAATPPTPDRPLRADAAKNRQRILQAAEAVFTTQGAAVPVDAVAERAGVGVGTVYRHFPTKEDLFEAIVAEKLEELVAEARAAAEAEDAGQALAAFLGQFARQASAKHDLFDAMGAAGVDFKARCAGSLEELKQSIEALLRRAQHQGATRGDASADEVIGLVVGACQAAAHGGLGDEACQRMVGIICDGIMVSSSTKRT